MKHISTGFRQLDVILGGGFKTKTVVHLLGTLGQGKTSLLLNVSLAAALGKRPQTVLYFSNNDCRHALLEKLVAIAAKVPLNIVSQAAFTGNKELIWPASRIAASPFFIVDGVWHPKRLTDICAISKNEVIPGCWGKKMSAPGLIVVDDITGVHDNLWDSPRRFKSGREHHRSVLKGLKKLAVELDAVIICVVPVYQRQGKKRDAQPRDLEKLFGTENVSSEQIYMRGELSPVAHDIELHAAGHPGKVVLSYDPALALFTEKSAKSVPGGLW